MEKEEDTESLKKRSDLNKYKMESLDNQDVYGFVEEEEQITKKITERKTKHVEEYRVAEKNYVKINEKED